MLKNKQLILQITDLHLFADPKKKLLGVNTYDSFKAVVAHAKSNFPDPSLILLTGDLAQDEREATYYTVVKELACFSCPIYWIPGNHDDFKYMTSVFEKNHIQSHKEIILEDWNLILLNSKKIGSVEGCFDVSQFEFLENCLGRYPLRNTILFMHHHPVPVGSEWLDKLMLTNHQYFWESIKNYHQVKAIFFGHVHQEFYTNFRNIDLYACPSTCFQFKRNSNKFALEKLCPGYRVIELYHDKISTFLHRVDSIELDIDFSTAGY